MKVDYRSKTGWTSCKASEVSTSGGTTFKPLNRIGCENLTFNPIMVSGCTENTIPFFKVVQKKRKVESATACKTLCENNQECQFIRFKVNYTS